MDSFKITNFGPINKVDVQLGDLTILLGPQASGDISIATVLLYYLWFMMKPEISRMAGPRSRLKKRGFILI